MARTAFVTSGSGFVGCHLVRRLCADGWAVRALTRSGAAAGRVAELGATPVAGELTSVGDVRAAADGTEVAFHVAAAVGEWGPRAEFVRGNVDGARAVVEGCRTAGVARLVHVSTEAVLRAGRPLGDVDETAPTQHECSIDIAKACRELGYAPVVDREEGLRELPG